MKQINVGDI